jgi:hypothetical protein
MKRSLVLLSFAACATGSDPGLDDGKGDGARFAPTFCGVNILESAGPVFVGEVCFGTAGAVEAVRVTYTDDATELYEVDAVAEIHSEARNVTVHRGDGASRDFVMIVKAGVPTSIAGTADRELSFVTPLAAFTATPKVTCYLHRRASIPGGERRVQSTIAMTEDVESLANSASLDAFEGAYGFDLFKQEGVANEFEVLFRENRHVQDETGNLVCSTEGLVAPASFCKEPIIVDANLGTDDTTENSVHAFNFWCRLF